MMNWINWSLRVTLGSRDMEIIQEREGDQRAPVHLSLDLDLHQRDQNHPLVLKPKNLDLGLRVDKELV